MKLAKKMQVRMVRRGNASQRIFEEISRHIAHMEAITEDCSIYRCTNGVKHMDGTYDDWYIRENFIRVDGKPKVGGKILDQ